MTEEHDHKLPTELPGDDIATDELSAQTPIEAAKSVDPSELPSGTLSLAGGGLLLVAALRSGLKGQRRAIPKAIAGAALLKYGLNRRSDSSDDAAETFEPTSIEDIEGETAGKETSDAAHASNRPDASRKSLEDDPIDSDDEATGSGVEFTDDRDEPRSKPDIGTTADDPRRNTDGDDEAVKIDVSDAAIAEENAEAAGPDPEQAQPSQTDAVEPEETPEEDASHKKVDPDDGDGDSSSASDSEAEADDENDSTNAEDEEADADTQDEADDES
ncbi:hypothetical protein G6M89_17540 [Natronolimnobius sp. AArcel1]|uniref:hypothetical protein n=1 Tax=Natronolimnobius sp. AArcel1 TaxID=1679093 RepID=UPI0013EA7FAE|nr:hypothetical protein [Natronolimnobius sp. AArcel1]NGM70781.1 hypothetical protein [Natronolimnobius sp. AArcel1]